MELRPHVDTGTSAWNLRRQLERTWQPRFAWEIEQVLRTNGIFSLVGVTFDVGPNVIVVRHEARAIGNIQNGPE